MKPYFTVLLSGAILTLGACAMERAPDTRGLDFGQADADHDTMLTYGEYQNYFEIRMRQGDAEAQKIDDDPKTNRAKAILLQFQKLDANRDTFVTRGELGL